MRTHDQNYLQMNHFIKKPPAKFDNVLRLIFAGCFLTILGACSEEKSTEGVEAVLRPVRSILVTRPDTVTSREFSAVVDASRKADLSFKISGEVVKVYVKQGEKVGSGKVLAKLNDADIKLQVGEANSNFEKAEADFARARKLIQTNTISKADYDQVKANFNSVRAVLKGVENNLSYTELKAPFKGVVAKKYIENFEEVNAKQAIFALHDLSSIHLKIDLAESIMARSKRDNSPKLTAFFDAIPDASFPLSVGEVSTAPDEITKTYEVTLVMKMPKNRNILPGMSARVVAEWPLSEDSSGNFYLPANLVLKDSRGNYVFTIADNGDGSGTVARTEVTIGDISQSGIEVFSGISEGDRVLTAGMSKVNDGMLVKF